MVLIIREIMSIKERLYKLIMDLSEVDNPIITDETNLIDDLSFDSVLVVSMIVEIESEFGIVLDDEDLELDTLTNFGPLEKMIRSKASEVENEY